MAVSILPVLQVGGMQVFRTESSDTTEKILPKTTQIASAVIVIYLILTLLCLTSYWIFGMNLFDALIHIFYVLIATNENRHCCRTK